LASWSTVAIFKSLCKVSFVTYQGAKAINRRLMDWKTWMVRTWEDLAHPQIYILYDQMDLSSDLYSVDFIWIDSLDLRVGLSRWRRLLTISRLNFKCGPYVSLVSSAIPKYFTWFVVGISTQWIWSEGRLFFRSVNGIWKDLSGFIKILHLVAQVFIKLWWFWRWVEAWAVSELEVSIAVSSPKLL